MTNTDTPDYKSQVGKDLLLSLKQLVDMYADLDENDKLKPLLYAYLKQNFKEINQWVS